VAVPVQFEGPEEVAQRRGLHVRRRRSLRQHEAAGVDRLQLDGACPGGGRGIHHGQRALERAAVVQADLGNRKHRAPRRRCGAPQSQAAWAPLPFTRRPAVTGTSSSVTIASASPSVRRAPRAATRIVSSPRPGPLDVVDRVVADEDHPCGRHAQRVQRRVEGRPRRLAARRVLLGIQHRVHVRLEAERLHLGALRRRQSVGEDAKAPAVGAHLGKDGRSHGAERQRRLMAANHLDQLRDQASGSP
jgi:hypothetical protein